MTHEAHDPGDLTPEERQAYGNLPRERAPGDLLEERVVRSLRGLGLLEVPATEAAAARRGSRGVVRVAAAAAAAVLLFLSGLWAGQGMGTRSATSAFLAVREQDAVRAADQVQAAGSAYVRALTRFAQLGPGASGQEVSQGREAALGALVAATEVVSQLEPDDPALEALLRLLQARRGSALVDTTTVQQVYWF